MRRFIRSLLVVVVAFSGVQVARGDILFSENFNTDHTANWNTNNPAVTDIGVDYFYDYSAIGVAAAPGGTGTLGLKMTANNANAVFGGFSVSPSGQNFTGSYRVAFNLWQNYVGPLSTGGSGTTQLTSYGVGTAGNVAIWPTPAKESVGFMHTLDGGSAADFRVYTSLAPTGATTATAGVTYAAGSQNSSSAYYAGFGGTPAPGDQLALYPGQTGTTAAGVTAFAWRSVVIDVQADGNNVPQTATWSIDGLQIAQVNLNGLTLGGNNIFFGHSDSNAGISTDPNRSLLNVTLIDNISVTSVPEPSTWLLGLIGATLTIARRRRVFRVPG